MHLWPGWCGLGHGGTPLLAQTARTNAECILPNPSSLTLNLTLDTSARCACPAQEQRDFFFYSSSVLLIYEGDVADAADARLSVRLVDFAHTFASDGKTDANFVAGLRALIKTLQAVVRMDFTDSLM